MIKFGPLTAITKTTVQKSVESLYKGFAALVSVLEEDDDHVMLFLILGNRDRVSLLCLSNGDMKNRSRLPENTMFVSGCAKT